MQLGKLTQRSCSCYKYKYTYTFCHINKKVAKLKQIK